MKKQLSSKGFSLVETLVAVAVLTLAVAGPLTIASNGIATAIYAKDQITAIYLAQEAIEAARNYRDSHALAKTAGPPLFIADCLAAHPCGVSIVDNPPPVSPTIRIEQCTSFDVSGSCLLNYNNATALYSHESGSTLVPTKFTRTLTTSVINGNEYAVKVTVQWQTNAVLPSRTFTVTEDLFNWQ